MNPGRFFLQRKRIAQREQRECNNMPSAVAALIFAALPVGLALWLPVAGQADNAAEALYTGAQAQAGAQVYAQQCSACHGSTLEGGAGPALVGPNFHEMAAAQALTAASLLEVVSTTMPQSNPGSLNAEQNDDVVAYLLQQNGYPSGRQALSGATSGLKALDLSK
jgi:mono/diheme cytochrome c family protein